MACTEGQRWSAFNVQPRATQTAEINATGFHLNNVQHLIRTLCEIIPPWPRASACLALQQPDLFLLNASEFSNSESAAGFVFVDPAVTSACSF